jgi:hypothetical protein
LTHPSPEGKKVSVPVLGIHSEIIPKKHSPAIAFDLGEISKFFSVVVEARYTDCERAGRRRGGGRRKTEEEGGKRKEEEGGRREEKGRGEGAGTQPL